MTCSATDPVGLTAALVRCPSVTPCEGGALELLADLLEGEGFACSRVDRGGVANLYARIGGGEPALGFAGHTDVVPPGPEELWSGDPFGGELRDGELWGRGAVDMKSGVAAFVAAACRHRRGGGRRPVALLVTGDEEGEAVHGTAAILDWMRAEGEELAWCVVCEPTSRERVGDTVKIGRRGSLSVRLTATGTAGHSAYPERARNPIPSMGKFVADLAQWELDRGSGHFDPSTLSVTTIETGNAACNVIPARCRATVNFRFNDAWTPDSLEAHLRERTQAAADGLAWSVERLSAIDAFLAGDRALVEEVARAVERTTGAAPAESTSGGTSDARFVKDLCPAVELGLVGRRMHEVDERVPVEDIETLAGIYEALLAAREAAQA